MSGRVLLAPSGIRISKPGVEVQTAGVKDLLLDLSVKQGQILQHGFMPLTAGSGGASYGPWSGSVATGPFAQVPDVKLGFVFAGNKQTIPAFQRVNSGRGFRHWLVQNIGLTANSLAVTVSAQAASVDGFAPQALLGLNFIIFRKGIL